jgi:20S proteasome alpha/beta subunit
MLYICRLLYSYKQRHPSSSASYLVSGVDEEGRLVVAVVPEAKLDGETHR